MQGRIEKNEGIKYNDTTVHSWHSVSRFHARMKICLQNAMSELFAKLWNVRMAR